MKITTIGLDLAKNVFHIVCLNQAGKEVSKKMLRRSQLINYFSNHQPCVIAMEACANSHYWGQELTKLGFDVKLIPPQMVKPYVSGNKNDYNDALAIAEAVNRPKIRFVSIKTKAQQDLQAMHRLREQRVKERTALANQLRSLLSEYGVIINKGISSVRKNIPSILEDGENGLTYFFRKLLAKGYAQLCELDEHIIFYTEEIARHSKQDKQINKLKELPGFGPIVASVFASKIGDGKAFRRGRDVSASLGLVPRQHSSGGKNVLLGISKRGDKYLRSLLIHGARSVVVHAHKKNDSLSRWITKIKNQRGVNKAAVALANKLTRIAWAMIYNDTRYKAA